MIAVRQLMLWSVCLPEPTLAGTFATMKGSDKIELNIFLKISLFRLSSRKIKYIYHLSVAPKLFRSLMHNDNIPDEELLSARNMSERYNKTQELLN